MSLNKNHADMREINRLRAIIRKYEDLLREGRHYLMGVASETILVEDALDAFGWTRDGTYMKETK